MSACDTCAFGKAGAAGEPDNALKSQLCAFGALPFYCHHGRDGVEYDWQNDPLGPLRLVPQNRKVCSGWREQVGLLKKAGYFPDRTATLIRRLVARRAIALFDRLSIPGIGRSKHKQAARDLKRCVNFVSAKDINQKGIPL